MGRHEQPFDDDNGGRLKLFDDDGDNSDDDLGKIEIDRDFAKRFEYNSTREEFQRWEELKRQGLVEVSGSDSEESSSEDEELVKPNKKKDSKFFDALIKVKNQDPVLKSKDSKLFDSDSEDDGDKDNNGEEKVEKKKPMYLKDVVSKHLIEAGPEFDDEQMENGDNDEKGNMVKSYSEGQDEIRKELLEAVKNEDNDDGGDFFRVKDNGRKDEAEDDDDDDEVGGKLDEYFGEDDKLDENTKFLKDYFRHRMWMDNRSNNEGNDEIELSEDEEEIDAQEDYEREFNFRFEENHEDRVIVHPRKVEGSVRIKENARKRQRESKEERARQAEFQRRELLKRLKNLKRKEINDKLEKIRRVAGVTNDVDAFLDEDDLDKEFDPDAYDRKMKKAFGDGYYDAKDVDPKFGSDADEDEEKPDFDKEDELLGLPKGWDECGEGFMSARERILKDMVVNENENENEVDEDGDENENENEVDEGDDMSGEGKRKRKRKPSEVELVKKELMEEYYKLDYEDTIGDLKTRFKYKPVKSQRYGLKPMEVFMIDDKELNQYVPLKKIAPYREDDWKVPRIKTIQLKQKLWNNGETSDSAKEDRKKKKRRDGKETTEETDRSQPAEPKGDEITESRGAKRRRREAKLKLPPSRLLAYGKIPSKSKKKN